MNGDIYQFVALLLQTAQAHNVTIDGSAKYNVPSVKPAIDKSFLSEADAAPPVTLVSYTSAAIAGADNFNDDDVTIEDVFDTIVNVTREVSPTCELSIILSYLPVSLTRPESSRNCLDYWVRARGYGFRRRIMTTTSVTLRMGGPCVLLNGFPRPAPSNSRLQFSSSETPSVHFTFEPNCPSSDNCNF